MTLPGIDRRIAQSIVDHRVVIGGRFQRIDDLALVSGIGAERLEQIRPEICIKRNTRSNQGYFSHRNTSKQTFFFSYIYIPFKVFAELTDTFVRLAILRSKFQPNTEGSDECKYQQRFSTTTNQRHEPRNCCKFG